MMTRKDYVAVSNILSNYQDVMDSDDYYEMVMDFGTMMRMDNDRFDLSRFMSACGLNLRGLADKAMASVLPSPKSAKEHIALVQEVDEGWGRAY
jgi:hypothetical protein